MSYQHLKQFLGCYFHQDWVAENGTDDAGAPVARFLADAPQGIVALVAQDIRDFFHAFASEAEVRDAFASQMECAYEPAGGDQPFTEWLGFILQRLERE